ncbi:hypothetical protein L6164_013368 [Bauhinia variegata]|uniref:Uncharacterized protein n=1 Tax=Bauhinia variegata TaxID=167791 RepID=A0ACB9NEV0_BAUVA|nr:hypothetical protein L6164_013368 [Bauhinia variegata]
MPTEFDLMQLSHGYVQQHDPIYFSIKTTEAQDAKLSPARVSITTVSQLQIAAVCEDYGLASQPTSPIKYELDYKLTYPTILSDWSPLDDGIERFLLHASSREKVDAHIIKVLTSSTQRRRLPVFVQICPDD